ncbi:CLUMA_CG004271, isoform B [Clunio marinus]|uniref:Thioredoxin n=1 Tax=Clunio marinus TaxID=568069 RepID=A0A1J1HWR6_9DIPT|nr:CLUMA_CG004271, isoform B [Clunio marinus]
MVYAVKDTADFDSQLESAGELLVLVDFHATWCGPCKMIAPKLEEFANAYADKIVIVKVDVDDCEELAMRYNISSMPTFVFIKKGQQIDSFSGANAEKLEKYIIQHSS